MYKFFNFFINFINLYTRYIYEKFMCTYTFPTVTERSPRMRHHPMGTEVAPCGAISPLITTEAQ
jgi:hypothetical protein